jgi:hypothetical protein
MSTTVRLSMAACPFPPGRKCSEPCETCYRTARQVCGELSQILRERHGGSSQVADWLDGIQ